MLTYNSLMQIYDFCKKALPLGGFDIPTISLTLATYEKPDSMKKKKRTQMKSYPRKIKKVVKEGFGKVSYY